MYDEKLIEDSLAFAEEIKAMLEGKKEAGLQSPLSSPSLSEQPPLSQGTPGEQAQAIAGQQKVSSQQIPVRQQTRQTVPSQPAPASQQFNPAASQQRVQPQQTSARPLQPSQQAVPPQQTPVRQPQQTVQQQTMPSQQGTTRQPQPTQQAPARQPQQASVRPPQPQAVPPQPTPARQPQQTVQQQAMPPQQAAQRQPQQNVQPAQQVPVRPQQQRIQPQQAPVRPQQQTIQPQPQAPVRQPQQTAPPQQAPVRQAQPPQQTAQRQPQVPSQSQAGQAAMSGQGQQWAAPVQQPGQMAQQPVSQPMQQPVSQPVQAAPQQGQYQPVQTPTPQTQDVTENPAGAAGDRHTYEITIKFDMGGIKKKFGKLKEKLAPETRTIEDVNAAMEVNRQLQAERQNQDPKTFAENGAAVAEKAAGAVKKLPNLLKKKPIPVGGEAPLDDNGNSMEAQVVQLEGEAVDENGLMAKLQDVKEGIPQKASQASRLVTNLVILAFCIGIAYCLASFVTTFIAHPSPVEGESMEPTLSDGDTVIIQRLSYYFSNPKRFDVVVFPVNYEDSEEQDTYYIKRVIGLPGETVQIIDGSVYINGSKLANDKYALSDILEAGIAEKQLVLGDNQYFVMGDNRNMSTDSRNSYVGLVNKNDIIGEAWICTWPLRHFGSLKR